MDFLPDTNILIKYFQGQEPEKSFLEKMLASGTLHLSVVSLAEVLAKASEGEEKDLRELMATGKILEVNQKIAETAAAYRKQFQRKTKKVYLLDCFLAASCQVFGLTLITNDKTDYPMRDIKIIKPS